MSTEVYQFNEKIMLNRPHGWSVNSRIAEGMGMGHIVESDLLIVTLVNNDKDLFNITRDSILLNQSLTATHLVFDSSIEPISQFYAHDSLNIYFMHIPPLGIYESMNYAIQWIQKSVTGNPYVLFLNSGDSLNGTFSQFQSELNESDGDFIYGKYNVIDPITCLWVEIDPIHWKRWHQYFTYRPISHQAILVRKSSFEKFGKFNTNFKVAADWDFILRCSKGAPFKYYPYLISNFQLGGFSSRNKKVANKELLKIRKIHGPKIFLFSLVSIFFYAWRNLRILLLKNIRENRPNLLKKVRKFKGWHP